MIPNAEENPVLTVDEVARLLGISRNSAYDAVANGEIPAIRIGKRIVIPTAGVLKMLMLI